MLTAISILTVAYALTVLLGCINVLNLSTMANKNLGGAANAWSYTVSCALYTYIWLSALPFYYLLHSVCMCGFLKFKHTIKKAHTINCIICCKILVYCLVVYSLSGIPNTINKKRFAGLTSTFFMVFKSTVIVFPWI